MKSLYACVRVQKIFTRAGLRSAERHGLRQDDASAKRVVQSRTVLNLAQSAYLPDQPLHLVKIYEAFKEVTGAVEGSGRAAIMLHLICVVSPPALGSDTERRDPKNPLNRILFNQAQSWARAEFGNQSLLSARLDVDEAGAGAVDLFICPTAILTGGRRKPAKLTISVNTGLSLIQMRWNGKRSFASLQDSWSSWARDTVHPSLERGKPKVESMRDHVHADIYRQETAALKKIAARLKAERARLIEWDSIQKEREARFHQTLEQARQEAIEEAKREVFVSLEGIMTAWDNAEIELDSSGTWRPKRGLELSRRKILSLWHKVAGRMAASIVRRFEAVLGPMEQEQRLKLTAVMNLANRNSGVSCDT